MKLFFAIMIAATVAIVVYQMKYKCVKRSPERTCQTVMIYNAALKTTLPTISCGHACLAYEEANPSDIEMIDEY